MRSGGAGEGVPEPDGLKEGMHLHKSRLCVVPYTSLDLLEPLAGRDVIKWVKTEQVVWWHFLLTRDSLNY